MQLAVTQAAAAEQMKITELRLGATLGVSSEVDAARRMQQRADRVRGCVHPASAIRNVCSEGWLVGWLAGAPHAAAGGQGACVHPVSLRWVVCLRKGVPAVGDGGPQ